MSPRRGFTLIEVLAIMLVITLGLMATIGLVFFGVIQSARAKGAELGMATAISVALDPQPLLPPRAAAAWTWVPYDLDARGELTALAQGTVNGFGVKRTEVSGDDDIIAEDGGVVYMRSARVDVDVYDAVVDRRVASFTTRIIRQRGKPTP
jgi:hypothetical protein